MANDPGIAVEMGASAGVVVHDGAVALKQAFHDGRLTEVSMEAVPPLGTGCYMDPDLRYPPHIVRLAYILKDRCQFSMSM